MVVWDIKEIHVGKYSKASWDKIKSSTLLVLNVIKLLLWNSPLDLFTFEIKYWATLLGWFSKELYVDFRIE